MNLEQAIKNINRSIDRGCPVSVDQNWVKHRCKVSYKFISDNIKDEFNQTDWDLIVSMLQRCNQGLWLKKNKRKKRVVIPYKDEKELNIILNKYKEKLYTFISRESKEDKIVCDWISIKLVRLSQRGNLLASDKIVILLRYLVDSWVDFDKSLFNWKGYDDIIDNHIIACIRRFRYAGSFIGYLYRTLEYSGRGLIPLEKISLDNFIFDGKKRVIDNFKN